MSDAFYGGGSSGAADPNLIQRLMAYIGGGGPPQSAVQAAQSQFDNNAPGSSLARQKALQDAGAQLNGGQTPLNINQQPTLGPNNPIASAASIPVNLPPAAAAAPAPFQQPDHPSTMRYPMWPTPPAPAATPAGIANAPLPPVRPKNLGQPAVRKNPIPGNATALAPGGKSPFTMVNRPNMGPAPMYDQRGNPIGPVAGGALARGGGAPLMSALDLSQLFGRQ